jgi:hypothetical protein
MTGFQQLMQPLTPLELKKSLIAQGFEIYRTMVDRVALAERVRDNLLMDGHVAACTGDSLAVRFTTRAQQSEHPNEDESTLLNRARILGKIALARGYAEVDCAVVPVYDPGDPSRTLDTWYEVSFSRTVMSLDELLQELRFALGLDKYANR